MLGMLFPDLPFTVLQGIISVMKKVLFVCTANICRSPMATAIFNTLAAEAKLPYRAESAGVMALEGSPMAPDAIRVLGEIGVPVGGDHRARQVSREMIEGSDLVLAMSPRHIEEMSRFFGALAKSARVLPEYAGIDSARDGIPDPYGLTVSAYRSCARLLFQCIEPVVERLGER